MTDTTATAEGFAPPAHEAEGLVLKDYVRILRRRAWVMLTVLVIVMTLGTVWVFKATPIYEAAAKILIERQSPRAASFEEVVQLPASEQEYYKTQQELLRSRAVMEKALEQPGIAALPEVAGSTKAEPSGVARVLAGLKAMFGSEPQKPAEPWERLRDCLMIEQVKDTRLLSVKAESSDPERAARIANAVANAFSAYHLQRKLALNNEAFAFLDGQKKEQEKRVLECETALQDFREKTQTVSLDVEDPNNPVLYRHAQLNQKLTTVRLARLEAVAQFAVVEEALAASGDSLRADNEQLFALPSVRADEMVSKLRTQLIDAETRLTQLSATYGPAHQQVQAGTAAVTLLRTELHAALSHVVGSLAAELETLTSQQHELEQQYQEENRRALDLARNSLAFRRLANDSQRQEKLFEVLVERLREVDLTTDYAKTNLEVIEAADPPRTPCRPRKALALALCALAGLVLSAGAAFVLEFIDDTVKTPEDLEDRVGIPVLGFVPSMDEDEPEPDGDYHRSLSVLADPGSHVTEAYRSIRTNLFYSAPAEDTKVIVVTSGSPGDGKTTTATNLAVTIAQSGKRVLLVDADLRRPMVRKIFGLAPGKGLSGVLVGETDFHDAVQQALHDGEPIENLDILPSGPKPPNPAELLESDAMRTLIEAARASYDRVIIDSPPALFVADTSIVAGISNAVILVVKSGTNPRSMAIRAKEQLRSVNARILGGILNDVLIERLGYYDSGYSYYGYSRSSGEYSKSYYASDDGEEGEWEDIDALDGVAGDAEPMRDPVRVEG